MNFFYRAIEISKFVGIAPIKRNINIFKVGEYVVCRKAISICILQVAMLVWMVVHFHWYIARKDYYIPARKVQVAVLMYSEIAHVVVTMVLSMWVRFPNILRYLAQCTRVVGDLEGSEAPLLARHICPVLVLGHTLLTAYRAKSSHERLVLMIPFWFGVCQVVMVHALLYVSLTLVDMSLHTVNKDLALILSRRPDESTQFVQQQLCSVQQRYSRASHLLSTVRQDFGPDVFVLCFIFMFKISFICYHIYYRQDVGLWGQNSLVGELTGHLQIIQLLVFTFPLTYVSDSITDKMEEARISLLFLNKSRHEQKNSDIKKNVRTFLMLLRSQTAGFRVCGHFIFNRQLLCNMVLGAMTYVFVLIQFQGTK